MANPRTTLCTVTSNREDAAEILALKQRMNKENHITDEEIFRRGLMEIKKEIESIAI